MLKIYYDGDCYFCRNYVEFVKLRNAVGDVELISVREDTEEVRDIISAGYNLNTGFVVDHDGVIYHGAEAYSYISKITRKDTLFAKVVGLTGATQQVAKIFYPILVFFRIVVLAIQGLSFVDVDANSSKDVRAYDKLIGVRIVRLTPLVLCLVYIAGLIAGATIFDHRIAEFHQPVFVALSAFFFLVFVYGLIRPDFGPRLYLSLRNARIRSLLAWFCVWIIVINTGDLIIERKILGLVGALPLMGLFIDLRMEFVRGASRERKRSLLAGIYPVFLIIFALFPGFYIAPFYGGIVGWVDTIDMGRPVEVSGIKFVNSDGKEIWHNPVFLQPNTQVGRFRHAFSGSRAGTEEDFLHFVFNNYVRNYPLLEKGRLPHQWALGRFAYPGHNLTHNNAAEYASDFAPDKIVKLIILSEYFDWDGSFVKRDIRTEFIIDQIDSN